MNRKANKYQPLTWLGFMSIWLALSGSSCGVEERALFGVEKQGQPQAITVATGGLPPAPAAFGLADSAADGMGAHVQMAWLDSRSTLEFTVPAGVQYTEIVSTGQFQGTGDVGEDVAMSKIYIFHDDGQYFGTQMIKIGSSDNRSRSVHFARTPVGTKLSVEGGYDRTALFKLGRNGKQRITTPLIEQISSEGGARTLRYTELAEERVDKEWWAFSVMIRHYY